MKRRLGNMVGIAALAALLSQAAPALADPPAHSQGWRNGQGHSENVRRDDHKHWRRDVGDDQPQYGWRADRRDDGRRDYRREDDWRGHDRDDDRRDHDRDHDWGDRNRDDDWRDHDRHRYGDRYRHDYRDYNRGRYYHPRYGYTVTHLPHRHRIVHHHGARYFYGDGFWYQPFGAGFMIVAPPIGLVVPFLPDAYTTLFFGGVPYYRAHDVYYVWRPHLRGYVVTDPPW